MLSIDTSLTLKTYVTFMIATSDVWLVTFFGGTSDAPSRAALEQFESDFHIIS